MSEILAARGVTRSFYGVHVLRGVDLAIRAGSFTGLIGPNGAGKSTFFNVISGLYRPDGGSVRLAGDEVGGLAPDRLVRRGLVRTFQLARGFPKLSVFQHLMLYGPDQRGESLTAALLGRRGARAAEAELAEKALAIARRLKLDHVIDNPVVALSGGQKKLVEIGRALMAEPKIILLDEPMAGVNPSLTEEIAGHLVALNREGITICLIEHDMGLIRRLCDPIIVMAEGRTLVEGSFETIAADERVQEAYLGEAALSVLEAEGIVAGYGAAEQILKGTTIRVEPGEIVTIIGPNGAGKSTFLKAVAGLVAAKEGSIRLGGEDVTGRDAQGRARAGISFVPQERNVFGSLTVAENLEISGHLDPGGARRRAEGLYGRYPMLAEKRRALARTLSGGQRQILAMAMGLMTDPKLMLLDEPTAGLSPKAADALFDAVIALNRGGLPILMVEQHAVEALAISTRGYVLVAGRNSAEGPGPGLAADPEIRRLFLGG